MDVSIYRNESQGGPTIFNLRQPDFPFLSSVQITRTFQALTRITIGIDAPFDNGIAMLDSGMFSVNNTVAVRIGWTNGSMSPLFVGILSQGGIGLDLSPDGLSGSITAQPLGKQQFYAIVHKGGSALECLRKTASRAGLELVFADQEAQDSIEEFSNVLNGTLGIWETIQYICVLANCTFEVIVGDSGKLTIQFQSKPKVSKAKPSYRFVMRGSFDADQNQYPVMSYSPQGESPANWFAPRDPNVSKGIFATIGKDGTLSMGSVSASESPMQSGQAADVQSVGDAKDVKATGPGVELIADVKTDDDIIDLVEPLIPVKSEDSEKLNLERVRSLRDEFQKTEGWTAQFVVVGIPEIAPGELLVFDGASSLYNGVYTIKEVSHAVGDNGFETTVVAWSGSSAGQAVGVNEQDV